VTRSPGEATQPPCKLAINMVDRHPKAHSWMEDDHKRTYRGREDNSPAGLMAPSLINCRGMMTGTGGGCTVLSSPWIILQLGHGIHHSASCSVSSLCSGSGSGPLRLLWPHSQISLASRLYHAERERETQAGTLLVLLCCKAETPAQFGEGFIYSPTQLTKKPLRLQWPSWRRNSQRNQFRFHQSPSSTRSQDAQDSPNTNIAATDPTTTMEGATCIVQEELPMTDCPD
jgi:hypothetical protein